MRRIISTLSAAALTAAFVTPVMAQKTTPLERGKRVSPHAKVENTIEGATISITGMRSGRSAGPR